MTNTKQTVYISAMCAITAVCAQLSVPLPSGVPVTLQTFAVALTGFLLGKKAALLCFTVYLLLGICGIPVFSGFSAGISKLTGVTGGFLWGFYPLIISAALIRDKNNIVCFITAVFATLVCHLFGILQYSFCTGTDILKSFLTVSAPFIIKDILSYIFAYFLSKKLRKNTAL